MKKKKVTQKLPSFFMLFMFSKINTANTDIKSVTPNADKK